MLEVRRILSKLLLIIFVFNCMHPISLSKNPVEFSKVYEGVLADNMETRNVSIRIADLHGDKKDYLIAKYNSAFNIFKFNGENWESIYNIDIKGTEPDIKVWTTGDLDNDKKDEIIIFKEKTIIIYDLDESAFIKSTHDFPYYIESAAIGDIDNDKLNELIMFCCDEPWSYDRQGCKYNVCVVKYVDQKLNVFWSDNQELGLSASDMVPPDRMICIADIENKGHNQLIITGGQSDVSPTGYALFHWVLGSLEKMKAFSIEKGSLLIPDGIKREPRRKGKRGEKRERKEIRPYMFGDIKPALIDGKTVFIGRMLDTDGKTIPVMAEIRDDNIKIDSLTYLTNIKMLFWANIDGSGMGILRIMKLYNSNIAKFEFYR